MLAAAQVRLQELQGLLWPSTQLAQKPARRENYNIVIITIIIIIINVGSTSGPLGL